MFYYHKYESSIINAQELLPNAQYDCVKWTFDSNFS